MEFEFGSPRLDGLETQMPEAGFPWGSLRRFHGLLPFPDGLREFAFQLRWNRPLIARRPILRQGDLQSLPYVEHDLAAVKGVVNLGHFSGLRPQTGHQDAD